MYALASTEVAERIGTFIDKYIRLQDGTSVPRSVQMFKDAFLLMLQTGTFSSIREIKMACLREQYQIIPDFLFEQIYALEAKEKEKCKVKPLDIPPKI